MRSQFTAQHARIMLPLQLPALQVPYAPHPMSGVGGSSMLLQMAQSVVRTARIMPPLQLPAQQVSYAPQPMSGIGGSYMSSQMPLSVVRTTGPSPTMFSRAHQPARRSGNKRVSFYFLFFPALFPLIFL